MNRTQVIVLATSAAFGLATVAACGGNGAQAPAAGGGQASRRASRPTRTR